MMADVRQVHELTRIENLPRVTDSHIDPAADEDARQLLKEPLDAEIAVRVALINNRELRAILRGMGIARGHMIQEGLLPNPTLEGEILPERNTLLELRVDYDITSAILAPIRARAAKSDLEAARYRAASSVIDLGYRVRIAFYRLQAAEQRLAIAQQVLDGFAASRDAARAIFGAGNIALLDLVSEETTYEKARITVAQIELDVAIEREQVQRLLGVHGNDTNWRVKNELSTVPAQPTIPEDVETRALGSSLDLMATKHRLEGLARRAGITRVAGWLPDISVDVHSLHGNPDDTNGSITNRGWRFGRGLTVGIPLFDRKQGTVVALEAEFDALMENYYGMAVDLRSAVREARGRVTSSHARARQYQEIIVPSQRRLTEQTLLQYNAMQLGIFHVLQARRDQLDTQLAYVETLREYWSAVAALDALLAGRHVSTRTEASANGMRSKSESSRGH